MSPGPVQYSTVQYRTYYTALFHAIVAIFYITVVEYHLRFSLFQRYSILHIDLVFLHGHHLYASHGHGASLYGHAKYGCVFLLTDKKQHVWYCLQAM